LRRKTLLKWIKLSTSFNLKGLIFPSRKHIRGLNYICYVYNIIKINPNIPY
jgi:hypothetical protein